MGTIIIYAVIAIAAAAAIVAVIVLVLPDDTMARPAADVVPTGLPDDREVGADDLNRMRLPVALRGYRMVETDAVLDRLSAEIDRRDREIARLRMAGGTTLVSGESVRVSDESIETDAPARHALAEPHPEPLSEPLFETTSAPTTAQTDGDPA